MSQHSRTKPPFPERMRTLAEKALRMELWTGVIGNNQLDWHAHREQRMVDAEDRAVAKSLGWPLEDAPEGDDVHTTILGDVNHPPGQRPPRGILGPLGAALLGAAIPGAGIIGYLLADHLAGDDTPAPVVQPGKDYGLGLRKLEDLVPK